MVLTAKGATRVIQLKTCIKQINSYCILLENLVYNVIVYCSWRFLYEVRSTDSSDIWAFSSSLCAIALALLNLI